MTGVSPRETLTMAKQTHGIPGPRQVLDRGHRHCVHSVWGERNSRWPAHSQAILKDTEDFTYQLSVRARGNADMNNHMHTHTHPKAMQGKRGENKCSIFHHMVRTEFV